MDDRPVICDACGSADAAGAASCQRCGALIAAYRPPAGDEPSAPPPSPIGRGSIARAGDAGAAARDLFGSAPTIVEPGFRTPAAAIPQSASDWAASATLDLPPGVDTGLDFENLGTTEPSPIAVGDGRRSGVESAIPSTDLPASPTLEADTVERDRGTGPLAPSSSMPIEARAIRTRKPGKVRRQPATAAKSAASLSGLKLAAGGALWVAVAAAIAFVRSVSDSVLGEAVGLTAGIVGVVMLFDALLLALARREGRKRRTRSLINTDTLNV